VPPRHPRGTLFSIFRPGVRVADLRPIGGYLVEGIEAEPRAENLSLDTFGRLDLDGVRLARTASRSTLGVNGLRRLELDRTQEVVWLTGWDAVNEVAELLTSSERIDFAAW
jgi:hypothetical protein